MLKKVIQCLVGTHLPLYQAYADSGFGVYIVLCGSLIVDIVPLQQAGVVLGLLIIGKVVAHHLAHVEVVRELKGQHRVEDFLLLHFIYVLLGADLIGIFVVVGDTSAKHDCLQVQCLAKFLAVFIHTACQTQATVLGMDKDFDAIKYVAFRIVGVESLLARNLGVSVVVLHIIVVHYDGKRTAHDFLVNHRHNLPLGEDAYQFFYLFVRPEHIASV